MSIVPSADTSTMGSGKKSAALNSSLMDIFIETPLSTRLANCTSQKSRTAPRSAAEGNLGFIQQRKGFRQPPRAQ